MAARIQPGMSVRVRAADEFFAYCDGWMGRADGWQSGYVVVKVPRDDIIDGMPTRHVLTLLVPEAQLEATPE